MNSLFVLTQNASSIFRPIAVALGWIMNWIYVFFDNVFHVQNIALTIVVFTIIIYLIMLPLTYQQQKFSKLSQIMNPELQEVQKKYRGKRDTASQTAMNAETQAIYRKYGVRPSGSCIFLVIQFLILIPLYRVINSVPGYVTRVKETFDGLVNGIMGTPDYQNTMQAFLDTVSERNSVLNQVSLNFTGTSTDAYNSIIDVLYRCTADNWHLLERTFNGLSDLIQTTQNAVEHFTNFLGASIVYSPITLIRTSAAERHFWLIFIAILIPVISAASQFLSVRLMPQANTGAGDQMGNQMRMMNYIMPIYSFFIVFFLPIGIGIYWIAGAIIRVIQQLLINRHFNKIDMQELIAANAKKAEEREKKKVERKGVSAEQMRAAASINTKSMPRSMSEKAASVAKTNASSSGKTSGTKTSGTKSSGTKSTSTKGGTSKGGGGKGEKTAAEEKPKVKYKEGSMAALANKVSEYNEKNSKSK